MDGWMDGSMDGWIDGRMPERVDGCIDDGRRVAMDGWMVNAWMDEGGRDRWRVMRVDDDGYIDGGLINF